MNNTLSKDQQKILIFLKNNQKADKTNLEMLCSEVFAYKNVIKPLITEGLIEKDVNDKNTFTLTDKGKSLI